MGLPDLSALDELPEKTDRMLASLDTLVDTLTRVEALLTELVELNKPQTYAMQLGPYQRDNIREPLEGQDT